MENTRKGNIRCACGQSFYFEIVRDSVSCIKCGKAYNVEDNAIQDVEIIEETEEPVQLEMDMEETLPEEE